MQRMILAGLIATSLINDFRYASRNSGSWMEDGRQFINNLYLGLIVPAFRMAFFLHNLSSSNNNPVSAAASKTN